MIATLGHIALYGAFAMALFQMLALVMRGFRPYMEKLVWAQGLLIALSFGCLTINFLESDFSVAVVAQHSHTFKPTLYKIAATWGHHEGSMLLWVLVVALYGVWLARSKFDDSHEPVRITALAVQGALQVGFVAFVLFTSNPFWRLLPAPNQGQGFNPLLQDIGLAIHPPLLYCGYVGFAIVFALGVAALIERRLDKQFGVFIKPFVMVPWIFLTLGIGTGSWWAYRELGWGGWWFWDPVENASLLPWLAGTALYHANILLAKQGRYAGWVALLTILCFSLSMIGTFLVRSGIITSVHSFVSDPTRGVMILAFIGVFTGGALLLYAFRGVQTDSTKHDALSFFSREMMILLNGLFLVVATLSILLATLYPMVQELIGGRSVSIGAPYFNKTFFPLMTPLVFLCGLSMMVAMKQTPMKMLKRYMKLVVPISIVVTIIIVMLLDSHAAWLIIGTFLGVWVIVSTKHYAVRLQKTATQSSNPFELWRVFFKLKPSQQSVIVGHVAFGCMVLAITYSSILKQEYSIELASGKVVAAGQYVVSAAKPEARLEKNFIGKSVAVTLDNGSDIITLMPELRFYPIRGEWTTEAALDSNLWRDVYIALRKTPAMTSFKQEEFDAPVHISLYYSPAMLPLWISIILIAFAGCLSLRTDRGRNTF